MNEDLHDIDDLFRDGLNRHLEEVPPAVWEAVNNDLDKKQASYYKRKYNRLKRAAVLLLAICFLSSAIIVFYVFNHKQIASMQKTPSEKTFSIEEKKKNNNNAKERNDVMLKNVGKIEKASSTNDTTSSNSIEPVIEDPAKKANDVLKKDITLKEHSVFSTSPSVNENKNKEVVFGSGSIPIQTEKLADEDLLTRNILPYSSLQLPLIGNDYTTQMIIPQFLLTKHNEVLPNQNPIINIKSKGKKTAPVFSLTAFAAPNFNFDRLEDDHHLAGPGRDRHDAHENEQVNISFSGGLLLNYGLTKNISVQSGITVTTSSTSIAPKTVYAKPDNNGQTRYELHCSSGYVYISPKGSAQPAIGDSATTSGTTSKLNYLSIPASINYRITVGRFSLLPSVGAGLNILTSGKTKTNLSLASNSENITTSISGLKHTYLDGQIGIGVEYMVNKKFSIGIRPNAKLALTPINQQTPVKSYQNFLSAETGVRIKF